MSDDASLLHSFAEHRSEAAFAEFVRRHLNLVYSAALRTTGGDAHLAQDACQKVFVLVAQRAAGLARHPALTGWLYTTVHFTASKLVRTELRRRVREREAQAMMDLAKSETPTADWSRIGPSIDEVMHTLHERDREAVLLRYFEGRPFAEVGARQGIGENAARMRVDRALERLRELLARRGIVSSATALAAFLTDHAVAAAPAGLATTVSGTAVAAAGAGAWTFGALLTSSKLLTGAAGIAAVAAGIGLAVQRANTTALRAELASLEVQAESVARMRADVASLTAHQIPQDELERLQRDRTQLATLRAEAGQLRARIAQAAVTTPAPGTGARFSVTVFDEPPRPKLQVPPVYPLPLLFDGSPGRVDVRLIIDQNGNVAEAAAVRSSDPAFEDAALAAVRKWKFTPGRKGGQPVNTVVQVPIVFASVDGPPPAP